jgi:hypothetical protein
MSTDGFPSRKKYAQQTVRESRARLLTAYEDIHILDKTVDNFEYLRCGHPSLIFCESVQPL